MHKFKKLFKDCLGFPIPPVMIKGQKPISFEPKNISVKNLYGSMITYNSDNLYLIGGFNNFIRESPVGHFLIGFWGYGVNSYAFYYSLVDNWRKISFRLSFGGVYGDTKRDAINIRVFLKNYFNFENKVSGKVKKWIAINSMGESFFEATTFDDKKHVIECDSNKLNLQKSFADLLK